MTLAGGSVSLVPRVRGLTALLALSGFATAGEPVQPDSAIEDLVRRDRCVTATQQSTERLTAARRSRDRDAELQALRATARAADCRGDRLAADRERGAAFQLARELGNHLLESGLLRDQAAAALQRAEYDAALADIASARALSRQQRDAAGEARALELRARVSLKTGRYPSALADAAAARDLADRAGAALVAADAETTVGLVHLDRRAFRDALQHFENAGRRAIAAGDLPGEIMAACNVAIVSLFQNAPEGAIAILERSLDRARAASDEALEARVVYILANAFRARGDHHAAITAYNRADAFYESEGHARERAWVLARRSRSELALGRRTAAEVDLQAALDLWSAIGERRPYAWSLYELALMHRASGDDAAAIDALERAVTAQIEIELPFVALVQSDLALALEHRGDVARAMQLARAAVDEARRVENPEMLWTALFRHALIERRRGDPEQALASLRESVAIIERLREGVVLSDEARAGFFESKQTVYFELADLLVSLGRSGQALDVSEQGRARALADLLAERAGIDRTSASRRTTAVESATAKPLSVRRWPVRRPSDIVIEYMFGEDRGIALIVDGAGSVHGVRLSVGTGVLARRIDALRSAVFTGRVPRDELRGLHRLLLDPLEAQWPRDADALVTIVPHGPLFLLPFACLIDGQGRFLVERNPLTYLPALHALARPHGEHRRHAARDGSLVTLVGVADGGAATPDRRPKETPATRGEVRAIAALFRGQRVEQLLDARATERRVRELAPSSTILHLATHAVARDDQPLLGYVSLAAGAGAADDDGRLTVGELFDLALPSGLVTLSGCNTAHGRVAGDGVLGLARGFLAAGASAVLASAWPVADPIGAWQMERFYENLLTNGGDRAVALRAAQLATLAALRQGALGPMGRGFDAEAPVLWAPFILIGDPRS